MSSLSPTVRPPGRYDARMLSAGLIQLPPRTTLLSTEKDWLSPRIAQRFDTMLANGALNEARANLPNWSPTLPSAKAIGAAQLIAHLKGEITLDQARESATIATRQFAKRQRSWFRARMQHWNIIQIP